MALEFDGPPDNPTALYTGRHTSHTSKACNRCRGKKSKCDGGRPCASCLDAQQNCVYTSQIDRRRTVTMQTITQVNVVIKGLEDRIVEVESRVSQLEGDSKHRNGDTLRGDSRQLPTQRGIVATALTNWPSDDIDSSLMHQTFQTLGPLQLSHDGGLGTEIASQVPFLYQPMQSFSTGLHRSHFRDESVGRPPYQVFGGQLMSEMSAALDEGSHAHRNQINSGYHAQPSNR